MLNVGPHVIATRTIKLASHNANGRTVAVGERGIITDDHIASLPNTRWEVEWSLGGVCLCSGNELAWVNRSAPTTEEKP